MDKIAYLTCQKDVIMCENGTAVWEDEQVPDSEIAILNIVILNKAFCVMM